MNVPVLFYSRDLRDTYVLCWYVIGDYRTHASQNIGAEYVHTVMG